MIMRGDLSGKHSRTPAGERGFSAEKDEGASQDAMEDNGTCTARQFSKGCDLPVTEPDSRVTMDSAYGFGFSRPASKTFSPTIRRPARGSLSSVIGMPVDFPRPIIFRYVGDYYDPWRRQPLPVPSPWTWDATSSNRQGWSQGPPAMEAHAFPCFQALTHPDSSWSRSVTLDTLSNYPQERSLAHANSDEVAPLRAPLVDPMSAGGSGFNQYGNPDSLSPELQSLPASPTQDMEPQPYSINRSIPQASACRRRLFEP